jgi:hypothetical protein
LIIIIWKYQKNIIKWKLMYWLIYMNQLKQI